ncbi:MAG TPA: PAS domain-containing sensor histidine kinase [Acidimicrobiia bacterium]|nr:PAS domain-containing sensor histidine kinase [Acidimicrobiia bacterium]
MQFLHESSRRLADRLARLAPSALGSGPPAVDGTSDPSGPRVVQMAVAGSGVVVHGAMYALSARPVFLWVAGLCALYLVVGVPLALGVADRSPSLVTWSDLATMLVLSTIMGDPITLLAWFPLLMVANVVYEATADAVRNAIGLVLVAGAYSLVMVNVSDRLFEAETARNYLMLTLLMWVCSSVVYALAVGGAVNRREAVVEAALLQRDEAERRARTEAGRLRAFLEEAPIGILVQDVDETFEYANSPALEMLGMTFAQLRTSGAAAALDPATRDRVEAEIRVAREHRKPFLVEHRTVGGRILELRGRHVELDGRSTTVTTLRDLTPERLAHGHIARLRTLVEHSAMHMVVWDDEGSIVVANRVFQQMWTVGEPAVGRSIIEVAGEQIRPFVEMRRIDEEKTYERWVEEPDGERFLAAIAVVDFEDPLDGRPLRAVTARDLTDVALARRQLEELVASKDQFIASVSHELRTPLTVVVGLAAEMAADPARLRAGEIQEFASLIAGQANEVAALVEDLLTMARADAGVLLVVPSTIDLNEEVGQVLGALTVEMRGRVTWAPAASSPVVADPVRVRQIVRNLVTNAGRHGGQRIEIEAGSHQVVVRDDGPPVPESERERMFQAYERVHEYTGTPDSVGLGLTVCRRLSRLMGGDVTYDHDGAWSRFTLSLPGMAPTRVFQPDSRSRRA